MSDVEDEKGAAGMEQPLGERIDLDAWRAQLPPSDFAERVLARVRSEDAAATQQTVTPLGVGRERRTVSARRRWAALAGGAVALALAAAILLRISTLSAHGEAIANERIEVAIGSRALAVLEPGASVRWHGDDVVQSHGDVFYRVEPGERFTVHTPAGDVVVAGTCFAVKVRPFSSEAAREERDMVKRDIKAGAAGAALSALAFVAVYEGKVAVSHANEKVELRAGEAAQVGPDGVKRAGSNGEGEKAFEQSAAAVSANDDPFGAANQNLVRQVGEYRSRLEAIVAEKTALETKLKRSEERLAAAQDGEAFAMKHEFDLSHDDWKELAKEGTVKFRMPCSRAKGDPWSPSPDQLNALALAPQDAATIKNAYAHSNERVWAAVKPLCAQAIGSAEVAEKLGPDTCIHLVLDMERARDRERGGDAVKEAMRQVAEIRAGIRQTPGPNEPVSSVFKMFLAMTSEARSFETELAQSFGPEEAHRIAYSDELCMGAKTFGGQPPPKK